MATRENLYRQFGPMMLEAIVHMTFDEINILRQRAGLAPRTIQQVLDALDTQINNLSKYDWMQNTP